jgi:membrane associated rhomboid family serine protease
MTQVPQPTPQPVVPVCYRHPGRETHVRCTRCDRPICPDCMTEAAVGHQCPECVHEGRRTQRSARTVFGGTAAGVRGYATMTLIGINTAVMVVSVALAGGKGLFGGGFGGLLGSSTPLTDAGAVVGLQRYVYNGTNRTFDVPYGVTNGEYYRLFTQMFLHYGLLHLAVNMWALWVIGRSMEAALGPVRFVALYLTAGLAGGVACYVFTPASPTAGASGAIFGLFAALFVVFRRLGQSTAPIIPLLVVNLAISFAPGISLAGHLGGLVAGGVVAAAFAYAPRPRRNTTVCAMTANTITSSRPPMVSEAIRLRRGRGA